MNKFAFIVAITLVTGCASTNDRASQPAQKTKVWVNPALEKKSNQGEISGSEKQTIFNSAKSSCKMETLKIHVPSPSCVQPPRQDCSGLTGFSKGFCQSYTPPPNCDYSAQNQAYSAQEQFFDLCMNRAGFYIEGTEPAQQESIKDIVNSIPQLNAWYNENGDEWQRAKQLDDEISEDPSFRDMPTKQRLLMITKMVEAEFKSN
ncbi:hypothetical protein FQP85_22085 [Pseudoalteromonas neustonica]|uniref:Uncharacterized protein n=1 Tax=Pseudoalteromonas neustonica TaxID=1840331 RepID=A0ABY3F857_9GAMM|nr:hypothetical protein [Pseudoalteromonas neustonica]TVU79884.1 hypothetical protein FQP85_22085 [Pseudoalteromonas neustonica]